MLTFGRSFAFIISTLFNSVSSSNNISSFWGSICSSSFFSDGFLSFLLFNISLCLISSFSVPIVSTKDVISKSTFLISFSALISLCLSSFNSILFNSGFSSNISSSLSFNSGSFSFTLSSLIISFFSGLNINSNCLSTSFNLVNVSIIADLYLLSSTLFISLYLSSFISTLFNSVSSSNNISSFWGSICSCFFTI